MDLSINGTRLYCKMVGSPLHFPLIMLHGGPGFDHTMLHPWLDALSENFLLVYIDQRGQGRSQPVDPTTLTLDLFADDINHIAHALGFEHFALFGHSYGAMIALAHAAHYGTATHYILSSGSASGSKSTADILQNLETFEPESVRQTLLSSSNAIYDMQTQEDARRIRQVELPFHFYQTNTDAYQQFCHNDQTIYALDVLKYFDTVESIIEYEDQLHHVNKPTLIMTGEYDRISTPRAARELYTGIAGSELVIIPNAGHMAYVEQPIQYREALLHFLGSLRQNIQ
ncbi:alpha/beta fold hydrolase [Dictyobacter arantiisoli]|uniref:Amino acid amidase n=1 Tax=Dictyobacter arantiisoli TaxID=2014874 RepID=A0A5A5TFL8_9CHLR|nr:alpha/beta fold hydrolase [Dictyobacter arantiisoli]GCF10370.1 amino acid amidase [Dictyobacter arantiisoli]